MGNEGGELLAKMVGKTLGRLVIPIIIWLKQNPDPFFSFPGVHSGGAFRTYDHPVLILNNLKAKVAIGLHLSRMNII